MQQGDEQQQVKRAKAGDRQAFAALVDVYWDRVFRWLFGLTHDNHQAEDLTQETFLKAWRGIGSFQEGASFRAWLFCIARNTLIDARRVGGKTVAGPLPAAVPNMEPAPPETVLGREAENLLQQACARLPAHFQEAFLLWSQDDLSFAEIALALGLTEETARWRVFKARLLLLRLLSRYLDGKTP